MSTGKTRKNPDYTESAVNLTNSPELEICLSELGQIEGMLRASELEVDNYVPVELKDRIVSLQEQVSRIHDIIRKAIDDEGSYQDTFRGAYAVKQKKQSWEYSPVPFLNAPEDSLFGQVRPLVIEQVVNVKALDGLIKGGILHEQDLLAEGVIKPGKVTFTYIIKAGEHATE